MTDGLGLRYSLIGPFETMQLNANGMLYRGEVGRGNVTSKLDQYGNAVLLVYQI